MTEAELAEIEALAERARRGITPAIVMQNADDLPRLVTEVRRLQANLARAEKAKGDLDERLLEKSAECEEAEESLADLQRENERLRLELGHVVEEATKAERRRFGADVVEHASLPLGLTPAMARRLLEYPDPPMATDFQGAAERLGLRPACEEPAKPMPIGEWQGFGTARAACSYCFGLGHPNGCPECGLLPPRPQGLDAWLPKGPVGIARGGLVGPLLEDE